MVGVLLEQPDPDQPGGLDDQLLVIGGDIIGAVSPQGADFSEPVTQNTKRFVRCFWALDKSLAYARHYPAINWNTSYSEYLDAGDFPQRLGPAGSRIRHDRDMVAHIPVILGEGDAQMADPGTAPGG